jgi:hypothetical protein
LPLTLPRAPSPLSYHPGPPLTQVNASNIKHILPEVFAENLVRGRGLLCRSIMKSQMASPAFTPGATRRPHPLRLVAVLLGSRQRALWDASHCCAWKWCGSAQESCHLAVCRPAVYAALVAVLNTKFPEIGELLLHRVVTQVGLAAGCLSCCIAVALPQSPAMLVLHCGCRPGFAVL